MSHEALSSDRTEITTNPLPVSGPLTDTELRATAVPVSGPLTDDELRATAVPVSGPLTDDELRATAVPISGALTDAELRATAVPISGALTDAELRATPVPVSGTVTASGPLTDVQLRATAVPVTSADATGVPVTPGTGANWNVQPVGATTKFSVTNLAGGTLNVSTATNTPLNVAGGAAITCAVNETTAPAQNAILATTGQLAAGDYEVEANIFCSDNAGSTYLELVHRNAADDGDVRILQGVPVSAALYRDFRWKVPRYTLATNERILWRVVDGSTTAGKVYYSYVNTRRVA